METLKQTVLWSGKWTFRLDDIRLPGGHEMTLAVVDHPGSVVLVPLLDDKVLMLRQFRPVLQRTILELPAGTLDPGEDPLIGAQRELREETGYRAERLVKLSEMLPSPGATNELMNLYLATDLTPDPLPMDDDEEIEVVPMPLTQLAAMALRGEIQDAKSVVGILQTQAFLAL